MKGRYFAGKQAFDLINKKRDNPEKLWVIDGLASDLRALWF